MIKFVEIHFTADETPLRQPVPVPNSYLYLVGKICLKAMQQIFNFLFTHGICRDKLGGSHAVIIRRRVRIGQVQSSLRGIVSTTKATLGGFCPELQFKILRGKRTVLQPDGFAMHGTYFENARYCALVTPRASSSNSGQGIVLGCRTIQMAGITFHTGN